MRWKEEMQNKILKKEEDERRDGKEMLVDEQRMRNDERQDVQLLYWLLHFLQPLLSMYCLMFKSRC